MENIDQYKKEHKGTPYFDDEKDAAPIKKNSIVKKINAKGAEVVDGTKGKVIGSVSDESDNENKKYLYSVVWEGYEDRAVTLLPKNIELSD